MQPWKVLNELAQLGGEGAKVTKDMLASLPILEVAVMLVKRYAPLVIGG